MRPKNNHDIPSIPAKQKGHIYFFFKDIPQSIVISAQFAPGKTEAMTHILLRYLILSLEAVGSSLSFSRKSEIISDLHTVQEVFTRRKVNMVFSELTQ